MKKLVFYLGVASLCAMTACNGKGAGSNAAEDGSMSGYESADWALNELRGKVRECVIVREYGSVLDGDDIKRDDQYYTFSDTLRFDKYGMQQYKSYDPQMTYEVVRNDAGQIVSLTYKETVDDYWSEMSFQENYVWGENQLPLTHAGQYWEAADSIEYAYDADGNLFTANMIEWSEGSIYDSKIKYDYKAFDDNGNWIKRIVIANVVETDEWDDSSRKIESQNVRVEKRQIAYYD